MKKVMLAVDVILGALIGDDSVELMDLMSKVRMGEYCLVLHQQALYWALASIKPTDAIHVDNLAELIRYACIDTEPWIGPEERVQWQPGDASIEHWRSVVSQE